ncbi:hypothetical protein FSST1_012507 [Fusarium sambucinum]
MDPFQRLPAEIRIHMLGMIPSHDTAFQLIQASPIMLTQFLSSERDHLSSFLHNMAGDEKKFNDLLQDAIGLVYFNDPKLNNDLILRLARQWKKGTLPNPLSTGDTQAIRKLRHIFASKSYEINIYLYKQATIPGWYHHCDGGWQGHEYCDSPEEHKYCTLPQGYEHMRRLDDLSWSEVYLYFRTFIDFQLVDRTLMPKTKRLMSDSEYEELESTWATDHVVHDRIMEYLTLRELLLLYI